MKTKYQHNLIPKELADNIKFGTSSIMFDSMGYPLRLFITKDMQSHWIDIPEEDIRDNDVEVKYDSWYV